MPLQGCQTRNITPEPKGPVGIGTAIAVLFFVESFATNHGLGFFILDAWSQLDYESMYAGIVGMGLLGVVLYEGVEILDRTLCRWNKI